MKSSALAWLIGGLVAAIAVIGGIIALRVWVINPYRISSAAMEPNILPGDVVWVYKLAYVQPDDVVRGDLLVHREIFEGKAETYIKRVIGIPGDRITTFGRWVSVNGTELTQDFVRREGTFNVFAEKQGEVSYLIDLELGSSTTPWRIPNVNLTVPAGEFFLLGDNRMHARDSRYTGCIHWADVVGQVVGSGRSRQPDPIKKTPVEK